MNFHNSIEISGKLPILRHVLQFSKGNSKYSKVPNTTLHLERKIINRTRMHSSRMRTVRNSSRLYLVPGGIPGPGGCTWGGGSVPAWGVYLVPGVPAQVYLVPSGDGKYSGVFATQVFADILCYFLNKSVMCNGAKNSSSRPNINLRLKRVYLPGGVPAGEAVYLPGGCTCPGGCTWSWGGHLPRFSPPVNRITDRQV